MCSSENVVSGRPPMISCTHDDTPPATYGYVPSRTRQTSALARSPRLAATNEHLAVEGGRKLAESARRVRGFAAQLDQLARRRARDRAQDTERAPGLTRSELEPSDRDRELLGECRILHDGDEMVAARLDEELRHEHAVDDVLAHGIADREHDLGMRARRRARVC